MPTEPLPEVVSAYVQRAFGYSGLAWLFGLGAVLVVLAVQVTNRREAAQLPATVATVLFLLPAYGSITPRPQLVSFVLLAVVLAAWLQTDRDLKPRWWLIPLTFVWSLCHGFWFIGAAYGFLFVVGIALSRRADLRTLARLALVPVASFLVVLLNPIGLAVFEAPFRVNAVAGYITEWQRTSLLTAGPLGALLMVALTAVLWAVTRTGVSWVRVMVLVSAVFWVWYAERLVIVGAIVAAPLLAAALDGLLARSRADAPERRDHPWTRAPRARDHGRDRGGLPRGAGGDRPAHLVGARAGAARARRGPRPDPGRDPGLQRLRDGCLDRLAPPRPAAVHRRVGHAVHRGALRRLPPGRDGVARVVRRRPAVGRAVRPGRGGRAARHRACWGGAGTTLGSDEGYLLLQRPGPLHLR